MSLPFNEMHNKIGAQIGVTIGDLMPYPKLAQLQDRQALADHIRNVTYALEPSVRRRPMPATGAAAGAASARLQAPGAPREPVAHVGVRLTPKATSAITASRPCLVS